MSINGLKNGKSTETHHSDIAGRPSKENVFADLKLSDADHRLAKAELAHQIGTLIRSAKLTQSEAARRLGIDQPKISALLHGRLKDFSTDRLLRFITQLGRDVHIHIQMPKRRKQTAIRVFTL